MLVNGNFEQGPTIPSVQAVQAVAPGNPALTGWSVIGGAVTIVTDNYWSPLSGQRSLALSSSGPGSIEQSFATAIGGTYRLTFWRSGEPFSTPTLKHLRVQVGSVTEELTFDTTPAWHWDMAWEAHEVEFTASSATTLLRFSSLDAGPWGPAIDSVRVELVSADVTPHSQRLALAPVAPDPVRSNGRIAFTLPRAGAVRVTLHDLQGREVALLAAGELESGPHELAFSPRALDVAPGLHFVALVSRGERVVRRCIVLP